MRNLESAARFLAIGKELTKKLRFHVARFLNGRTYATIAIKLLRITNMYTVAIAKPPTMLSPANLGLNLVSVDEDEGFLDDYELEDDD